LLDCFHIVGKRIGCGHDRHPDLDGKGTGGDLVAEPAHRIRLRPDEDDAGIGASLGELSFNEKGDRTDADYVVYQWKKGDDGKYNYFQID
jgi:hypothetical protein